MRRCMSRLSCRSTNIRVPIANFACLCLHLSCIYNYYKVIAMETLVPSSDLRVPEGVYCQLY